VIEDRLQELANVFAIEVAGFAILDSHLHVLVKLEPETATEWSDENVVRRWGKLYPPRGKNRKPLRVTRAWVEQKLADKDLVDKWRSRLSNLGWFMKCLKEPLARLANKQDGCRGAFWQSRFKSIAILDIEALLATCVYIDLNPLAAGIARLPEESKHTSIRTRVQHCRAKGRLADLQAARLGSVAGVKQARGLETGLWLCPIEDRRAQGIKRAGMLEGFSLGSYLLLVDETSRLVRPGKAQVSNEVASMLTRLGTSRETWTETLTKMFSRADTFGVAFTFHRDKLTAMAAKRGCQRLANFNGCPA